MADDAILRETKRSIDALFNEVGKSAQSASSGLRQVGNASMSASSSMHLVNNALKGLGSSAGLVSKHLAKVAESAISASQGFNVSASFMNDSLNAIISDLENMGSAAARTAPALQKMYKANAGEEFGAGLKGTAEDAAEGFSGVTAAIALARSKFNIFTVAVGAAVGGLVELGGEKLATLSTAMDAAGANGMQFGNDLIAFGRAANNMMMTEQEYAMFLRKNSESLSVFGGTAQQGANALSEVGAVLNDFSKGIGGPGTGEAFTSFIEGFTMMGIRENERAELLGEMMGNEALAAKMRKMTAEEIAEQSYEYAENLSQLSVLTGKNRKELATQMKQRAMDAQFQAATYKLGAKAQQAMQEGLTAAGEFGGSAGQEIFKAGIAGVVPKGAEARKLLATPAGEAIMQMAQEMRDKGDEAGSVLENSLDGIKVAFERTRDEIAPLAAAGVGNFTSMFETVQKTTNRFQGIIDNSEKASTSMGKVGDSAITLSEAFADAYDATLGIVTNADGTKTLGTALTRATKQVETLDLAVSQAISRAGLEALAKAGEPAGELFEKLMPEGLGFNVKEPSEKAQEGFKSNNQAVRGLSDVMGSVINSWSRFFDTAEEAANYSEERVKSILNHMDKYEKEGQSAVVLRSKRQHEALAKAGLATGMTLSTQERGRGATLGEEISGSILREQLTLEEKSLKMLEKIAENTGKTNTTPTVVNNISTTTNGSKKASGVANEYANASA
jgi:hypothetical protein